MKYIQEDPEWQIPVVEVTRWNLETLLEKLNDPASRCTLIDPDRHIAVRAVENEAHYSDRPHGSVWMPSTGRYRE